MFPNWCIISQIENNLVLAFGDKYFVLSEFFVDYGGVIEKKIIFYHLGIFQIVDITSQMVRDIIK